MTMHSLTVGLIYVALVMTPCVIALFSGADRSEESESDVVQDGFV